ncbi:MAG: methyltransferase [Arachnia propionica]|nr:MAG: methyltransferase [Arachnia propionica]
MSAFNPFSNSAIGWLTVWSNTRLLTMSPGPALARRLAGAGHDVFALGSTEDETSQLARLGDVTALWARFEALPVGTCEFDTVTIHQRFHTLDANMALSEIARVLRPGGCLSASYIIRDDSVPWVRRLAAVLRNYDPTAMQGDYGQHSLAALERNKYFPEVEQRAFRIWQEIDGAGLLAMVSRQPLWRNLDEGQRATLSEQVMDVFQSSVRPGDQLRLPYQLLCVRAFVDHDELTASVAAVESAINILM